MLTCSWIMAFISWHKENTQTSFGLVNDHFNYFLSRWELSEEEESGGSDVETLVNQKQTVVSQTLDKLPVAATKYTA